MTQVYSKETNSSTITRVVYSHDGQKLAVSSKDCTVSVYDATGDYRLIAKTSVVGAAMCCDWSCDDQRLCAALTGGVAGLAVIDTTNYNIISQEKVLKLFLQPLEPQSQTVASSESSLDRSVFSNGSQWAILRFNFRPSSLQLASYLIYSYAIMEYINPFAVDRMVTFFFTMLPSVKFADARFLYSPSKC